MIDLDRRPIGASHLSFWMVQIRSLRSLSLPSLSHHSRIRLVTSSSISPIGFVSIFRIVLVSFQNRNFSGYLVPQPSKTPFSVFFKTYFAFPPFRFLSLARRSRNVLGILFLFLLSTSTCPKVRWSL